MTSFKEYRERAESGTPAPPPTPALPAGARALQGDRAGFVSRAIAAWIDVVLVFVVVLGTVAVVWMLSFLINPTTATEPTTNAERVPSLLVLIIYGYVLNVLYWTAGWAISGRTIGNLIMGLRVVDWRGNHLGVITAFVRAIFCTLFAIGLLWAIISRANRSVQDVVLRTSVIYDWPTEAPRLKRVLRRSRRD